MTTTTKPAGIRKRQELEVGRRYKGSAVINEFGEFDFRAYQEQDVNVNAMRKVTEVDGDGYRYTIYHSDDKVKIAILVPREEARVTERRLLEASVYAIKKLLEYEL